MGGKILGILVLDMLRKVDIRKHIKTIMKECDLYTFSETTKMPLLYLGLGLTNFANEFWSC